MTKTQTLKLGTKSVAVSNGAALKVGDRVKTLRRKCELMIGIDVAAGVVGARFVNVEPLPPDTWGASTMIEIKLDVHHDDLDEWNNVLMFATDRDETVADYVEAMPAPIGRVHVSTSQYERSHGRSPRGQGNWAFFFDASLPLDGAFWFNGLYSDAKQAAKVEAARRGKLSVIVGS